MSKEDFIDILSEMEKVGYYSVECWVAQPSIRKDLGYPPLVTPTSQMVGTQAVVCYRWRKI
jgi:pyruvate/oxaloacetate carboxyltransferase